MKNSPLFGINNSPKSLGKLKLLDSNSSYKVTPPLERVNTGMMNKLIIMYITVLMYTAA